MATSPDFVQRQINVTISTADGSSFAGGGNTMTLSNHRITSRIVQPGLYGRAELAVYGMCPSEINELSTLGQGVLFVGRNSMVVTAGDAGKSPATVFEGNVQQVYFDAGSAPDVMLRVSAQSGLAAQISRSDPKSFPGTVGIVDVLSQLAAEMGFAFENNGVTGTMRTPYLRGTALEQAKQIADAARVNMVIDNGTLAIWPIQGADGNAGFRTDLATPLISPATGMIGYPTWDSAGVLVKTIFNPDIRIGGKIEIQQPSQRGSSAPPSLPAVPTPTGRANGIWIVRKLDHSLDAFMPNGLWQTTVSTSDTISPLKGALS